MERRRKNWRKDEGKVEIREKGEERRKENRKDEGGKRAIR